MLRSQQILTAMVQEIMPIPTMINDGVSDTSDAFPLDSSESVDTDGDGAGNNADTDDDNDGVADSSDAFPVDAR